MAEEERGATEVDEVAETNDDDRVTAGWRVLGVLLTLALLIAAAVMISSMIDLASTPVGEAACRAEPGCSEFYDGTSGERAVNVTLGFASGVVAALGAIAAFVFALTGRRGDLMLMLTAAAVFLGAAALVFGSIA